MEVKSSENYLTTEIETDKDIYILRFGSNRYTGDTPDTYEITKKTKSSKQIKKLYNKKIQYVKGEKCDLIRVVNDDEEEDDNWKDLRG
tara:strand:+ start:5645 stop:5908 length:264 start_codon:yes stop_codon:yes gene_type:complete